jgi:hypothetical protein
LRFFAAVVLAVLPLLVVLWLWRRVSQRRHLPRGLTLGVVVAGAAAGGAAVWFERLVLGWTGLSFEASVAGAASALLAQFALAAPLEEGLKVLVVWPLYTTRRITSPLLGSTYAVAAAAGFASAEAATLAILDGAAALSIARLCVALPAHLFFAGFWGYALGSGRSVRGSWFSLTWLIAMLLHGLYDHIVFGRGPGLLVLTAPLLLFMALAAWLALREVAPQPDSVPSSFSPLLAGLPEPPSLGAMRQALQRTDRPLMLHWIAIGALVTIGVMIALIALAVFVGHRIGIDFAMADEADVRSSAPLALLGAAVLAAFPIAGYLVARASAAHGVLEPAMAAGIAIVLVIAMLSVTAPIAVVFALAVAPVAFAQACGGARFGLER